jgi:hypothetical protein
VAPEAFDIWLNAAKVDAEIAAALIAPAGEGLLDVQPVSNAVNRPANDSAALVETVTEQSIELEAKAVASKPAPKARPGNDDGQASLF